MEAPAEKPRYGSPLRTALEIWSRWGARQAREAGVQPPPTMRGAGSASWAGEGAGVAGASVAGDSVVLESVWRGSSVAGVVAGSSVVAGGVPSGSGWAARNSALGRSTTSSKVASGQRARIGSV